MNFRNGATGRSVNSPHSADVPVLLQHRRVDVLRVGGIFQVRLDDEVAEVDLSPRQTLISTLYLRKEGLENTLSLGRAVCPKTRESYPGLNSDHAPSRNSVSNAQIAIHRVLIFVVRVAACVVRVHAKVVA